MLGNLHAFLEHLEHKHSIQYDQQHQMNEDYSLKSDKKISQKTEEQSLRCLDCSSDHQVHHGMLLNTRDKLLLHYSLQLRHSEIVLE